MAKLDKMVERRTDESQQAVESPGGVGVFMMMSIDTDDGREYVIVDKDGCRSWDARGAEAAA